jgi:hypothetical protein
VITFGYGTLTYVQKLFFSYKDQNRFIQEYTDLKKRLDHESVYSNYILEERENLFKIKRGDVILELELKEKVILFRMNSVCDTFHFEIKQIKKDFEPMTNPALINKLLKNLSIETEFSKQKFAISIRKNYDALEKLNLDQSDGQFRP